MHRVNDNALLGEPRIEVNQLPLATFLVEHDNKLSLRVPADDTRNQDDVSGYDASGDEPLEDDVIVVVVCHWVDGRKDFAMVCLCDSQKVAADRRHHDFFSRQPERVSAEKFAVNADVKLVVTDENVKRETVVTLDGAQRVAGYVLVAFTISPRSIDERASLDSAFVKVSPEHKRNVRVGNFSAGQGDREAVGVGRCRSRDDKTVPERGIFAQN